MRATGPATSAEAITATAELPDIFKLDDLSVRPTRTIPENQEEAEEEEDEDEDDVIEEEIDGFIALSASHCVKVFRLGNGD